MMKLEADHIAEALPPAAEQPGLSQSAGLIKKEKELVVPADELTLKVSAQEATYSPRYCAALHYFMAGNLNL